MEIQLTFTSPSPQPLHRANTNRNMHPGFHPQHHHKPPGPTFLNEKPIFIRFDVPGADCVQECGG